MYGNHFNKPPSFLNTSGNTSFGTGNISGSPFGKNQYFGKPSGFVQTTSAFGQPSINNTSGFSSMPTSNFFQTPSSSFNATPTFNAGSTTHTGFGSNLFGQPQQQQPTTNIGLLGSTNTFGQNKPTPFGFGSTPNQTSLFGTPQTQQQPTGSTFFQPNANLFGNTSAFGAQPQTGTVIKFNPVTGSDTMQKNGVSQSISTKHHCITCMKEYENKSLEELRYEDYLANRKGPQQQTGFNNPTFGATPATQAPSLFGQTDNKPSFGQTPGFGQTAPTFGQTNTGFGISSQQTGLFGAKPTGFATPTSSTGFGFGNTTSTVTNPFNANQQNKSFTQPIFGSTTTQATTGFGTGVFGQTNQNTSTGLFNKPQQPTTGFNTGQTGFSFNQPSTTQNSLFQVSKPNTTFGLFNQNTTIPFGQNAQSTFGTSTFGKTQTTGFQPTQQPMFNSNLGMQQQNNSLFGNTAQRPSIFGTTNTSTNLFGNTSFQPTSNFNMPMNFPQQTQIPSDPSADVVNLSLIASDIFPNGPHAKLEPIYNDTSSNTTNRKELQTILDFNKRQEDVVSPRSKIQVQPPKTRRDFMAKDLFETNHPLKVSCKRLVIKPVKKADSLFNKYKDDLMELAERIANPEETQTNNNNDDTISILYKNKNLANGLDASTSTDTESEKIEQLQQNKDESTNKNIKKGVRLEFEDTIENNNLPNNIIGLGLDKEEENMSLMSQKNGKQIENENDFNENNPSGVILKRPEYYMIPPIEELPKFMNEKGECLVKGLTIGRKGYGNVHFPDTINVKNLNLDEIVFFRHKEIVIYPNDDKKPPIGEGLNRPAQVTLDKVYPRVHGTNLYLTDPQEIIESDFRKSLKIVTYKHDCKFVDYRPETGSWVFKVKHFSKYAFTESDEEESEIHKKPNNKKKNKELSKTVEVVDEQGLGGFAEGTKNDILAGGDSVHVTHLFSRSNVVSNSTRLGLTDGDFAQNYKFMEESLRNTSMLSPDFDNEFDNLQLIKSTSNLFDDMTDDLKTTRSHYLELNLDTTRSVNIPRDFIDKTKFDNIVDKDESEDTMDTRYSKDTKTSSESRESFKSEEELSPFIINVLPKCYTLEPFPEESIPKLSTFSKRCYTDLGFFKAGCFKPSWAKMGLFNIWQQYDGEFGYTLNELQLNFTNNTLDNMIPNMESILYIALDESECTFKNDIPTYKIKNDLKYLERIHYVFEQHVIENNLSDEHKYLTNTLSLCWALWGELSQDSPFARREALSDWLKKSLNTKVLPISDSMTSHEIVDYIFQHLTYFNIDDASNFAMDHDLNYLSMLISQLSGNETFKKMVKKYLKDYTLGENVPNEFRKIYVLLSGTLQDGPDNICDGLDWQRAFGLHLWYLTPSACPISEVVKAYKNSFENDLAERPTPFYVNKNDDCKEYDIIFQILLLYTRGVYQLTEVLNPNTHTKDFMDYRFSWCLFQVLRSLNAGVMEENQEIMLHTTFSNQLEQMGLWKWAVFVLLYLRDDTIKKNLIIKILERNLAYDQSSLNIENELIDNMKVPFLWIYEVKSYKALSKNNYYDAYQYLIKIKNWTKASNVLLTNILPELFVNDKNNYLNQLLDTLKPYKLIMPNYKNEIGLFIEYFEVKKYLDTQFNYKNDNILTKFCSIIERIKYFPICNNFQKLCLAELSQRCAFILKNLFDKFGYQPYSVDFIQMMDHLVMPVDYSHYEIFYLIDQNLVIL